MESHLTLCDNDIFYLALVNGWALRSFFKQFELTTIENCVDSHRELYTFAAAIVRFEVWKKQPRKKYLIDVLHFFFVFESAFNLNSSVRCASIQSEWIP